MMNRYQYNAYLRATKRPRPLSLWGQLRVNRRRIKRRNYVSALQQIRLQRLIRFLKRRG